MYIGHNFLSSPGLSSIVFRLYVTGHGFGHVTHVVEVARHLISAGHDVQVVTAAPEFVFTSVIQSPRLDIRKVLLDCGAVQADALTVDCIASLEKGEKGDPEKLRRKREELEKLQREDKAQLQAEAKAVEDAQRLAEAEAAAEAKKKRELEREAARQALLEMEKTIEIDENSRFLEELEMLSSAPPPHLPSVEMSPDHSLGGLNAFNVQGSNPLEQLGLYMKMNDKEEEWDPVVELW